MDKKELLRLLKIHTKGTGLFPEAMMAQMITESGMNNKKGLSQLSTKYNNYSGQKASGVTLSKGKEGVDYVIMGTEEDLPTKEAAEAYVKEKEAKGKTGGQKSKIEVNPAGGYTVTLGQPFRIFKTPEEGVSGHVRFLTGEGYQQSQKDRYAKVRAAKTPEEQIIQLKEAGYATDSEYVNTVTSVLNDSVRVDFPQFATPTTNTEQLTTADLKGTTGDQIIPGTGTTIDEGTSNIASLIDRNRQITANYDFLQPGDNEALELAEKELRETMIKDHGREWKDEKGFVSPEKRGGTEGFRNQANEIVIRNLSQGLDGNTSEGAEALKRRIRGFTKLVNNETYQKNISKAYEKQVPQTFFGSELAYIDLVSDSSFNETQLVQASGDYTFKADQIGFPHVSKRNVDDATEAAITEIAANNPVVQQRILNGEYDQVLEDYQKGIIKLVKEDKSRPENVTSALVEEAMDEAPIKEGEAAHDARIKQMLKDTGSYNEDGTLITEKQANKKEAARIAEQKALQDQKDASKLKNAEMALTGLKAAAGIISLSQALKAPEVETPELSPLLLESLQKSKELAESGMTSKEKSAAMQNLNDAYAGAMKNVLRASGGQRGMFLANQGVVDAGRIQGLNQLAAEDAKLKRQNVKQYNALASSVGTLQMNRDMSVETMRQATINNNRKTLSGIGGNLLSDALSDVGYYLSPNREKMMDLTNQLLNQTSGSGTKADVKDTPITTASLYANDVETDNVSTEEIKPE